METNLFRYIWRHTRKEQLWILAVVLLSMPVYFLSLDLPKRIVNSPIQGDGFVTPGATQPFLKFSLALPEVLGGISYTFPGFDLERLPYLVALSLAFLALVCVNGLFKFYINTYKGRLGERMLRRLRYELVDRLLRFPYGHFRRVRAPEIATMVKDEVEPLGGFIGDAYVSPVFLGGQALTAMGFILLQSYALGMIAGGIVLVQAVLIPKLRRRLLELGRERQLTARDLAGRVGEIVDSIADVRTNDTSNYERAGISSRLSRIFFIRYEFYQRKFFVKFLNNFLAQVTPFLFYLVGGYFAIRGSLDIGQLVAVIAAYKDLPSPIKELIDWDQRRLDVEIKYTQVVEQFAPEGMMDSALQAPGTKPVGRIDGPVEVESVTMMDDTGGKLVEDASFVLSPGEHVATVGEPNSGAEAIAEALIRLHPPTSGRIRINNTDLSEVSEALTGQRIAYVSGEPTLQNVTLTDCVLYGLKRAPGQNGNTPELPAIEILEARASGNPLPIIDADWIDYDAAGVSGPTELKVKLQDILRLVELDSDVFDLGLRSRLDLERHADWSEKILEARVAMRKRIDSPDLGHLIEAFNPETYNDQMTVAGNLIFGRARNPAYESQQAPENSFVRSLLRDTKLDERLFAMGRRIAETMVELFADLEPSNPFLEQLTFMTPDELPTYRGRLARDASQSFDTANDDEKAAFLRLALTYIEPQHRLNLLDNDFRQALLDARKTVFETLPDHDPDAVWFYNPETYNPGATLQDNILFGRLTYGVADGPEKLRIVFRELLNELDMNSLVFDAGLEFTVGTGGRRLTGSQRQKVGLARALIKRPDILVVNRGLSALSARSQTKIMKRVLKEGTGDGDRASFATYWVLMNTKNAIVFDRVLVFESGRLVEDGTPQDLLNRTSRFANLIS